MSESDDTDDLLLIPPDLFVISSDPEDYSSGPPYFNIVDNLISQVNDLDSRVNFIERNSDTSLGSSSLDYFLINSVHSKYSLPLMSANHETNVWQSGPGSKQQYIPSTHSTPQKPRTKLKLNSLPSTPSTIAHTTGSSQNTTSPYYEDQDKFRMEPLSNSNWRHRISERDKKFHSPINTTRSHDKVLSEIDSFISNVHTIKKYDTARNLKKQFDLCPSPKKNLNCNIQNGDNSIKSRLNMNDVDDLLNSVECKQRDIEIRLKQRESQLEMNRDDLQSNIKKSTWRPGDTKSSVPDYGMGMRDSLYSDTTKSDENCVNVLTAIPLQASNLPISDILTGNVESTSSDNTTSPNSSNSTQLTAYNNQNPLQKHPTNNLNQTSMHTQLEEYEHRQKEDSTELTVETVESKSSDYKPSEKDKLALINLSELWNQPSRNNNSHNYEPTLFFNKLQEEKLRRKHCEQIIQKLQVQTLEFQEQLAVAIEVDSAKDEAILRVHNSWQEAATKIDNLFRNKLNLEEQLTELRGSVSFELSEAAKQIKHYEEETFKAINLAHSNQEKVEDLVKENKVLLNELQMVKDKLKDTEEHYEVSINNNNYLKNVLGEKENEIQKNETALSEARKEVSQSKKAVEICHNELSLMKEDQNRLESQIGGRLDQIKLLEVDKKTFLKDIEEYKKNEKALKEEVSKQKDHNEKTKLDLRNYYQNQVEIVVQDKLQEFQTQLDKAESALQGEIRNREMAIAKSAALYIQQIVQKHDMEVHLLEEKHSEETKLYQLRLSQLQQQVDNLHYKFQQQQESRTNIAQKLHRVMEAQWLEALKIINNGKPPIVAQDKSTNTIDQLNSLKSKSFTNVEEILQKELPPTKMAGDFKTITPNVAFESSSFFSNEELNEQNIQLKQKLFMDTPVSSRPEKNKQQTEIELQKYIHLLLNKAPGASSTDGLKNNVKNKNATIDHHSGDYYSTLQWQKFNESEENDDASKYNKGIIRDRSGKPPWK